MLAAVVLVTMLRKRNERPAEGVAALQNGSAKERAHRHGVDAEALMKTVVEE